ncbi:MAG: hypothetical protein J6Y02_16485 [Pseudobutyrivibrio sp.]|nr:hypothetical protein [Pseudobutyrivibrio sp.]
MGFKQINPNPNKLFVGDCAVRAVSTVLGISWDEAFLDICAQGFIIKDMPSSDAVWGTYLKTKGFTQHTIQAGCEFCYTLRDFCKDHPEGSYVVATGTHAVSVIDGDYLDTADCGDCIPIYYFRKEEER